MSRRRYYDEATGSSVWTWLAMVLVLYVLVSLLAYNIRHPEQTQMQVFGNIEDAIFWR